MSVCGDSLSVIFDNFVSHQHKSSWFFQLGQNYSSYPLSLFLYLVAGAAASG